MDLIKYTFLSYPDYFKNIIITQIWAIRHIQKCTER